MHLQINHSIFGQGSFVASLKVLKHRIRVSVSTSETYDLPVNCMHNKDWGIFHLLYHEENSNVLISESEVLINNSSNIELRKN